MAVGVSQTAGKRSSSPARIPTGSVKLNYSVISPNSGLILSLYSSFICDNCLKSSGKTRKENKFSAKSTFIFLIPTTFQCGCSLWLVILNRWCRLYAELQPTRLGTYIEDRVNKYLKRQSHPEAGEVFVRVVASSDKTVEIKPGMKSRWAPHLSAEFPSWSRRPTFQPLLYLN